MKNEIKIELDWDDYNTALLTGKLIRHVKRHQVTLKFESKPGSILSDITIYDVTERVIAILVNGIALYLLNRIRIELTRNKHLKKPKMYLNGKEVQYGSGKY